MKKNNVLLGGLLVVGLLGAGLVVMFIMAFVLLGGPDDAAGVGGTPTRSTAGQAIVRGTGSGNDVSRDFIIPSGCNRQELTYEGTPTNPPGGFINFSVYAAGGIPGDFGVGPVDLDDDQSGAALWTLEPGVVYSIEITADAAEWSYELKCR